MVTNIAINTAIMSVRQGFGRIQELNTLLPILYTLSIPTNGAVVDRPSSQARNAGSNPAWRPCYAGVESGLPCLQIERLRASLEELGTRGITSSSCKLLGRPRCDMTQGTSIRRTPNMISHCCQPH